MNENNSVESYLNFLREEINEIVSDTRVNFLSLNENQFNWKPDKDEWSVAQCLEHLRMNLVSFIPVFDKKFRENTNSSIDLEMPYKNSFLGKRLIRFIGPEGTRKLKTSKKFTPQLSNYHLGALDDFITFHDKISEWVEKARKVNIKKVRIVSPAIKILNLSMGDMLRFIIAHEQRHIKQAKNVMQLDSFPS
jgi:DinB family protein